MKPKLTAVQSESPTSNHINDKGLSEKTNCVPKLLFKFYVQEIYLPSRGIDIAPIVFPIPKTKIHFIQGVCQNGTYSVYYTRNQKRPNSQNSRLSSE